MIRLPRLRFSLRTLIFFVLLASGGFGLWQRWEAWFPIAAPTGKWSTVRRPVFSHDGKLLAGIDDKSVVHVWDAASLQELTVIDGPFEKPESVVFSRDNTRLLIRANAGAKTVVQIRDVASGRVVASVNVGELDDLLSGRYTLALSIDNRWLIANHRSALAIYDTVDGMMKIRLRSVDARVAAADETEWERRRSNLERKGIIARTCSRLQDFAHLVENRKFLLDVTPDGWTILTYLSGTGCAQTWDTSIHKKRSDLRHFDEATDLGGLFETVFSPDGRLIAACAPDKGQVVIWQLHSGEQLSSFMLPGTFLHDAVFSADNSLFLACTAQGGRTALTAWDVRSGAVLSRASFRVLCSTLSPGGERILIFTEDQTAICDSFSGKPLFNFTGDVGPARDAAFSPDGELLAIDHAKAGTFVIWCRRRPEWWWGVGFLPEFWLTVICVPGLLWSLWRDRRIEGRQTHGRA